MEESVAEAHERKLRRYDDQLWEYVVLRGWECDLGARHGVCSAIPSANVLRCPMMLESDYRAREREQTVLRYNGGAPRLHVLPGEDFPDNHDLVDFYGFIYEGSVPTGILEAQRRIRQQELKREKKWEKLLVKENPSKAGDVTDSAKIYGNSERHLNEQLLRSKKGTSEKLIRRVYKGIPTKLRCLVWTDLLRQRGMVVNTNTYEEMVCRAHKYSPDIHQIDLDVNRTYRNTTFFKDRYGPRQRQLFNVLAAYSMYNTDVGYCQGMSEIAAFLLMHLNEEADVFWALHTLFTHRPWQMHGFFIKGFPKLTRYFDHHDYLLSKHLPRLYKHLRKLDIHPSCYAFKWYMQCFIGLPYTLTLRLWDIFLVIGERLLIYMSFTIMKLFRNELLRRDQSDVLVFMHEPLRRHLIELGDNRLINDLKEAVSELRYDWRPQSSEVEVPPASHFGKPLPPDYLRLAHDRQADQHDVEATLRRSLRRSGQSQNEAPPSPYDNAPDGAPRLMPTGPNGSVHSTGPTKSHSLPENVTLGSGPGRRIRSQASSPMDEGKISEPLPPPPPPPPPVPPHQVTLQSPMQACETQQEPFVPGSIQVRDTTIELQQNLRSSTGYNQTILPSTGYNQDLEQSTGYKEDLVPSTRYNQDVLPSTGYEQDLGPASRYNQDVLPSTGYEQDLGPASRYNQDLAPSTGYNQDLVPTTGYNQDLVPTTGYNQDLGPSTGYNQDLVPSTGYNQDLVPSTGYNQDLVPSTGYNQDLVPSTGHNQDLVPSTGYNQDLVPTTGGNQDLVPSTGYNQDLVPTTGGNQDLVPSTGYNQDLEQSTGYNQDLVPSTGYNQDLVAATGFEQTSSTSGFEQGLGTSAGFQQDPGMTEVTSGGRTNDGPLMDYPATSDSVLHLPRSKDFEENSEADSVLGEGMQQTATDNVADLTPPIVKRPPNYETAL